MTANEPVRPLHKQKTRTQITARLNDDFRQGRSAGRLFVTPGIIRHSRGAPDHILTRVRQFDAFTTDNDPYGEHDFGALDWNGERVFWKIDYYDRDCSAGSHDPADPNVTTRVLTIMLASEY